MTVDPWRVAQIAAYRGPGQAGLRGSGYLIAPGRVLTAAHIVAGASVIRWWADPAGHEGTDLAVVIISGDVTGGRTFEPVPTPPPPSLMARSPSSSSCAVDSRALTRSAATW